MARMLTLAMRSNISSDSSSSGWGVWPTPALLTTMSTPPSRRFAVSARAATSAALDTSTFTPRSASPSSAARARAASSFRSATMTRAPSSAKRRAMPAPKPEAPPVTIARLPSSRFDLFFPKTLTPLSVMGRDGLERGEGVERLEPLLATVARFADAAEGQFNPARGAIVVDKDLSGPQPFRQPHLPPAVGGPDPGDQAVVGAVGDGDGVVLGVERNDDDGRAEDFLLRQRMIGSDVCEQR